MHQLYIYMGMGVIVYGIRWYKGVIVYGNARAKIAPASSNSVYGNISTIISQPY